ARSRATLLVATWALAACTGPLLTPSPPPTQAPAPVAEPLPDVRNLPPRPMPIPGPGTPPPVGTPPPPRPPLPPAEVGSDAVLRLLPTDISDRRGWAMDVHRAFTSIGLALSDDNICAALAVIEQESSWQADPAVPGLPRIVRAEIEKRRARYGIPKMVLDAALLKASPDGRSYRERIDRLRTERQTSALFEDMIAELPFGRTLLADQNPIRTGGPMQVSIRFAEEFIPRGGYPYPRGDTIRHEVFTRRGGLYFGIANLLAYPADYPEPLYRFADFNAGQFSSRNAAFQAAVARLSGRRLALDGDLLRYADGVPSSEPSATQKTLHGLTDRLGISLRAIDRDLSLEKGPGFSSTRLYQRVYALAEQQARQALPRQQLPRIDLSSPKIQRKLTTEWFARRVDGRYRACLARAS
ncbi:MAG: DUF1615 domain-containing protein, partial [Zoogloeaceae bacterium]|nr:DUF1615 domain-containing protein [Zoogloeaceae bacterium]